MDKDRWTSVDRYFERALLTPDAALDGAIEASRAAGLPDIQVTPLQGRLLAMLVRLLGASRVLELGTLGGYSTIWMAQEMPPAGRLLTVELERAHAEVARANLTRAGVANRVELRVGPALDVLRALEHEGPALFDLCFLDADKDNLDTYAAWALRHTRPGGAIVLDNVVRDGAVLDEASNDPRVRGVRRCIELLSREPRAWTTAIQTVGAKGYDGFAVVIVRG